MQRQKFLIRLCNENRFASKIQLLQIGNTTKRIDQEHDTNIYGRVQSKVTLKFPIFTQEKLSQLMDIDKSIETRNYEYEAIIELLWHKIPKIPVLLHK